MEEILCVLSEFDVLQRRLNAFLRLILAHKFILQSLEEMNPPHFVCIIAEVLFSLDNLLTNSFLMLIMRSCLCLQRKKRSK